MGELSFIYSGVIVKNGDKFNSHCLDVDISSSGSTIEEARNNLVKALSKIAGNDEEFNPVDFGISSTPSTRGGSIVEEFYFNHNLSLLGNMLLPGNGNGSK